MFELNDFQRRISTIFEYTVNIAILGGMLCVAALLMTLLSGNSFTSSLKLVLEAIFLFLICPMLALAFGFGAKVLIFDGGGIWRKAFGILLVPPAILFAFMFVQYVSNAPSSDCVAGFRYC